MRIRAGLGNNKTKYLVHPISVYIKKPFHKKKRVSIITIIHIRHEFSNKKGVLLKFYSKMGH
jgi:hypothetical protein